MPKTIEGPVIQKPQRTLQGKAILGVVLLVSVSTSICGFLTAHLAVHHLKRTMTKDARLLTDTASRYIATQMISESDAKPVEIIENMIIDQRVAFVVMRDPSGRTIARRVSSPESWYAYSKQVPDNVVLPSTSVSSAEWISVDNHEVIAYTLPLWVECGENQRVHNGYLTMAMQDPATEQMITYARAGTLAIVIGICLVSIVPTVLITYRWVKPLKQMIRQSWRLAAGMTPQSVSEDRNDEIGQLTVAFNSMARKLFSARSALEQTNAELENKVEQRTQALRLVNDQLELQMKDKDEFIRAITHDLNAPLRNIEGMTKILLRKHSDDMPEEAQAKLERIHANAINESEMLADLLELSRVRSQPGRDQPINPAELARTVVDTLEFEISERGVTTQIDRPIPTIIVDRIRMRQVYQNLIENAVKYMPAGNKKKLIRVGCDTQSEQPVFFVSDTGRGIDPQDDNRVFQVFQRARYSGDHDQPGRGVGLASVKTIIESYGGRIWIDRDERINQGQGATFCFTIGPHHLSTPAQATQALQAHP